MRTARPGPSPPVAPPGRAHPALHRPAGQATAARSALRFPRAGTRSRLPHRMTTDSRLVEIVHCYPLLPSTYTAMDIRASGSGPVKCTVNHTAGSRRLYFIKTRGAEAAEPKLTPACHVH